jgi:hypothetical protein
MISEELVRQEVSELHQFIEPMVRMCSELRADYPVFSDESREFFDHIQKLGNETLTYLLGAPDRILKDTRLSSTKRQSLLDLRYLWENLHEYLRPALDADSLHLPNPLISTLHDRIHETDEWHSYRFTLFHTTEANYLQLPMGIVGTVANDIAALVGGKQFPAGLGHVGMPYSQSDHLFMNCTLGHEMGHFIYQEDVSHDAENKIDSALERMEKEIGELGEDEITFCQKLVSSWIQEVFCDLFAICLIGPAYSFAYSQLVAASMLIGRPRGVPEEFFRFGTDHPADLSRFRNHRKLLEKLGWWQIIRNWSSAPVQILKTCTSYRSKFALEDDLPETVSPNRLLQCYNEVCNWLIGYVPRRVKGCRDHVADFMVQSPIIAQYLQRAIVPSTIIVRRKVVNPSPIVLINAGYEFLLEKLPLLLSNIKGESPNSIESRSRMGTRLELWLLKALEDHRLLVGGASQNGSPG